MKRRIGATLAGTLTAMAVFAGMEMSVPLVVPVVKAHLQTLDAKALEEFMRNLPTEALLWILLGYVLGSFCGGVVAGLVAKEEKRKMALYTGIVLTAGSVINFVMLPHPFWFMAVSFSVYVPAAYLGVLVIERAGRKDSF
jgi:predicted MFS family arabinose efflux permease